MTDHYAEAVGRFQALYGEACATSRSDPDSFMLATADARGRPSIRTMTLRRFDAQGLVFFTSSGSRKGLQLAANPWAAACFYWPEVMVQVKIEGPVETLSGDEANRLWERRDRESQLVVWASRQSAPLDDRAALRQRFDEYKQRFRNRQIPRPEYCTGYRVVPERIEFWEAGWHRLHEGLCFEQRGDGTWERFLLNP